MTWWTVSANEDEADKDHYVMILAADFDFPSGHIRLWSGLGQLVIDGQTYHGAGELARVTYPRERSTLTSDSKTYQLAGVDPSLVSEADIDASFGRTVTEYLGFMGDGKLLANPEINWIGEMSNVRRVDGSEPVIEVNAENALITFDRVDGWRYTSEHQLRFYAGDEGFSHMAEIEMKEVLWGGRRVQPGRTRREGSSDRGITFER